MRDDDSLIRKLITLSNEKKALERKAAPKSTRHLIPLAAIIAITTACILAITQHTPTVSDSQNVAIIQHSQDVQVHYQSTQSLRQWAEVPRDERDAIKAEAIKRFPEIKNIGEGVSWQPIAEWLAETKHISHPNPRDLFRHLSEAPTSGNDKADQPATKE